MHSLSLAAATFLSAASLTLAKPLEAIVGRAVGDSCKAPEGPGSCQSTSKCKGISYPQNLCPNDPDDIQCCVEIKCNADGGSGYCRSKSNNGCPGGSFRPGTSAPWPCPGDDDVQCCIAGGSGSDPPPPTSPSNVGEKVLAKAKTQAGKPYAWGGGDCDGPTGDQPPWDNGEVGFDCSGLVCYAVCQVTGRNLFNEGLRNTHDMYCASESTLKYKKYPYSERKAGDAVFFGGACSCGDRKSIHHVGLMMSDGGDMLWNAPDDSVNEVKAMPISSFSKPCPNVIRFT